MNKLKTNQTNRTLKQGSQTSYTILLALVRFYATTTLVQGIMTIFFFESPINILDSYTFKYRK